MEEGGPAWQRHGQAEEAGKTPPAVSAPPPPGEAAEAAAAVEPLAAAEVPAVALTGTAEAASAVVAADACRGAHSVAVRPSSTPGRRSVGGASGIRRGLPRALAPRRGRRWPVEARRALEKGHGRRSLPAAKCTPVRRTCRSPPQTLPRVHQSGTRLPPSSFRSAACPLPVSAGQRASSHPAPPTA